MTRCLMYRGMSYEQASREAARLIAKADEDGCFSAVLDDLLELRDIMRREARFPQGAAE